MMGRWRSGAPLALCPMHDDPALGEDPTRNNSFLFKADDATGYKTPPGSHVRRCNPRDAEVAGVARLHRMIRRGTAYGPLLPPGVLQDDGAVQPDHRPVFQGRGGTRKRSSWGMAHLQANPSPSPTHASVPVRSVRARSDQWGPNRN